MKELDKGKAYDLKDLSSEQLTELLEWLIKNDTDWKYYDIDILKVCGFISFNDKYNEWIFGDCNKELINALELFKDMKITEEQKEQLINLNDSRVNEILGVNPYNKWYRYGNTNFLMFIHSNGRYGFKTDGVWCNHYNLNKECNSPNGYTPATHEEVEKALIAEAKKRGFKSDSWHFNERYTIMCDDKGYIFENGFWRDTKPNKQEIINQINELLKQL